MVCDTDQNWGPYNFSALIVTTAQNYKSLNAPTSKNNLFLTRRMPRENFTTFECPSYHLMNSDVPIRQKINGSLGRPYAFTALSINSFVETQTREMGKRKWKIDGISSASISRFSKVVNRCITGYLLR